MSGALDKEHTEDMARKQEEEICRQHDELVDKSISLDKLLTEIDMIRSSIKTMFRICLKSEINFQYNIDIEKFLGHLELRAIEINEQIKEIENVTN